MRTPSRFGFSAPLARRAGWGLADQMLSSLTNFALGILVARTVPLEDFGAFSLAFAAYAFVMSVTRAFPMEPLAIRYTTALEADWQRGVSAAVGTVLAVGAVGSITAIVAAAAVPGPAGAALLALGVTLPGLLVQDAWRSVFFARGRGRSAAANDLVWAIVLLPSLGVIAALGVASVFSATLAWGGAACLAALFGLWQARVLPRPSLARSWWREQRDLGPRFIAEVLTRQAGSQLVLYGIGIVAGLASLGALRAGQLVLAPIQVFIMGIGLIAVPEGARALRHSLGRLLRLAIVLSTGACLVACCWGAAAILLPPPLGTALLGAAFPPASVLLPPLVIGAIAGVATVGPAMGLRALAAAPTTLRLALVTSCVTVVFGVGGASLGQAAGAAWGLAAASTIAVPLWWRAFLGVVASRPAARGGVMTSPRFLCRPAKGDCRTEPTANDDLTSNVRPRD